MLKWRHKLTLGFVVFAALPSVLISVLAFDTFYESSRNATLSSLEGIVRAKADAIDQFTVTRMSDVRRLSDLLSEPLASLLSAETHPEEPKPNEEEPIDALPELDDVDMIRDASGLPPEPEKDTEASSDVAATEVPAEGSPAPERDNERRSAAHRELLRTLGLLLGEQSTFEELLVIASDGEVLASTFAEHEGKTAAEVEYFERGRVDTYVQPVFESPITGELTMVIASPIRGSNNEVLGVLAARLNLKRFFRLINDNTGLGKSGEVRVGRVIGDSVVLMAPTRHDAEAALRRKVSVEKAKVPIVAAARGETASAITEDMNEREVLAAWTFVPSLEWGVVAALDLDEASAAIDAVQGRLIVIAIVVIGFALLASLLLASSMVRPLRDLRNATDKISKGDLDVELTISSNDELGALADSFERMVAAIRFFRGVGDEDSALAEEELAAERGDPTPSAASSAKREGPDGDESI